MILFFLSCGKKKGDASETEAKTLLSITLVKMERAASAKINFQFVVNLENLSSKPITVDYTTANGTAKEGQTMSLKGPVTIPANQPGNL